MSEGAPTIRLSKAAREFNIGITTVIDFLNNKGFKLTRDPNAKLSQEMYNLLMQEFASEKHVKEEAKKIGLQFSGNEVITIDDKREHATTREKDQEDLIIKNTAIGYEPATETEVAPVSKEKEPARKPEEKKAEEKKEEKKEPVKEQPVSAEKPELQEEPKATEPAEKKAPPSEEQKTVPEEPEKKTGEPVKTEKPESPEPEEKEKDLKILGMMDLKELEKSRTRRGKKDKKKEEPTEKSVADAEKPEKEAPAKTEPEKPEPPAPEPEAKKPVPEAEKPAEPTDTPKVKEEKPAEKHREENFLPTEKIKLEGPTILGSIDLPEPRRSDKKKPVASSSDDAGRSKKKKRKRIKRQPGESVVDPKAAGKGRKDKRGKDASKVEISEEDIQKQIKETMSRLSPTGKSKGSKHRRLKREQFSKQLEEEQAKLAQESKIIQVTEFVTANELATMMNVPVTDVISTCMTLGIFVSINQRLDAETLTLVAEEFGYQVEFVSVEVQEAIGEEEEVDESVLQERSPIVTVMGHVDHGKTKLLDYIRSANVVAGEAGGITQHIGAYEVTLKNGKSITFLDTPGHEAFTAMRARGAKVTDVTIVVIAADEDVMPQTKEAINHAQAAGVPIVFAFNKIDKPNANPDKLRESLSKMNILVEEWGGKFQTQEISAKAGTGVDDLLEKVLFEAELQNLKANPNALAIGTVIESSLDKGRGYIAKLLVQNGTLNIGDIVLAGSTYGRVKAMYNERNQAVKEAGPSSPVLMLGLNGAPQAGDGFNQMTDEREAKSISTKRLQLQREQGIRTQKHITLDEIGRRIAIGDFKELNIIVKADVDGSVEALADSLIKLSTQNIVVNVIHKSVGQITETDVLLASASNAIIVGFQVRPSVSARKLAEHEQIDIRLYSIIYQAIEEIKDAMEGMLSPEIEEKITCNVEIREVFKITKVGTVAGCYVLDGKINRNTKVRIIRDGIVVYTGTLASLKRFKDDVREVSAGYECGLNIENFNDIKVGDIIEGYEITEVKRKL